jgi:hypothetical protein
LKPREVRRSVARGLVAGKTKQLVIAAAPSLQPAAARRGLGCGVFVVRVKAWSSGCGWC